MSEIWDLYDRDGNRTGRTMRRGDETPEGCYHLVVHIWPFDARGRFLIQRRALHLPHHPGVWAATGGSAITGESSLEGAMRETEEELGHGFAAESFIFGTRLIRNGSLADIWYVRVEDHEIEHVVPGEDVAEVRWIRLEEIPGLLTRGAFFDYGLEYLRAVGEHRP